jgi:hypothetical protein
VILYKPLKFLFNLLFLDTSTPSNVVTIDKTLKDCLQDKTKLGKCILGKLRRRSLSRLRHCKTLQGSTSKDDILKILRKPRQPLINKKNKINRKKKIAVISTNKSKCEKKKQAIQKSNSRCLNKQTLKSPNENDHVESNYLCSFNSRCGTHFFSRSNITDVLKYNTPKSSKAKSGTHTSDSSCYMPINKDKSLCYQNDNGSSYGLMKNPVIQSTRKISKSNHQQSCGRPRLENGNEVTNVIDSSSTCHDSSSNETSSRSESLRLSRSSSGSTRGSNRSSDSTTGSSSSTGSNTTKSCSSGSTSGHRLNTHHSHSSGESSISGSNDSSGTRSKAENTVLKDYNFNCNHNDAQNTFDTKNQQWFSSKHISKNVEENSNKNVPSKE